MISLYFGLPGSGKTTMFVKLALNATKGRNPKYKHVYGNIELSGVPNYTKIDVADIGKYMLEDCLILVDEGSVHFSSREYKNFSKELANWVFMHRHYKADFATFVQRYNNCDINIRALADRVYYIHKGLFTGWYKSKVWRIPYGIIIPDKKDTGSAKLGEIIEGYAKPNLFVRLFSPSLKRARYYQYFDSWERPMLPALPLDREDSQKAHNKLAYANLYKYIKQVPKWRIIKRKRLTFLLKQFKKVADS